MSNTMIQTLKGFRDFLPDEKQSRDFVTKKIIEVFERFGFLPLETPTLEYASLLLGKYGKEADKLVYKFLDRGERLIALRYDQTVPTARVLAQYQNQLPKYFRRYQIQNVFRADKPQQGRFREFTQCDVDIFGSTAPIADAEIIATTYFAFKNVGFPKITLQINDRQTLFSILQPFATKTIDIFSLIQTIDKLEKLGSETVIKELVTRGITQSSANQIIANLDNAKLTENLRQISQFTEALGVPKIAIKFQSSLARGLDYYTGMIFEVKIDGYGAGSCGGGGRYDKLIKQLGGPNIPAVGIAFGFDRIVEAAQQLKLVDSKSKKTTVLITIFDQQFTTQSLTAANQIRNAKISCEVYPALDKLDKQLKYANRKGIPFVIIIGPEEAEKNLVKIKNMKTGEQNTLTSDQTLKFLISN